jgi:hypothetical protein
VPGKLADETNLIGGKGENSVLDAAWSLSDESCVELPSKM